MGFVAGFKGTLGGAYAGFLLVGAAIVLMVARIFILRIRLLTSQKRTALFLAQWRPILSELAVIEKKCSEIVLPSLKKKDQQRFIALWLDMQESLADEAHDRLNLIARHLGAHRFARRYLNQKGPRKRMLAAIFLGHLKDRASREGLEALLHDENPIVSIVAARSLMRVNPQEAAKLVFSELLHRDDWPEERVGFVFRNTLPPELADKVLYPMFSKSDDHISRKLVPYVELMHHEKRDKVIFDLLTRSRSDRLTSRVLKKVENPDCIMLVRQYSSHPRWHVRMQAVAALGRIGRDAGDIAILSERLGDGQWWVRYRAAQALVRVLRAAPEKLCVVQRAHQDPYARRMLGQVMDEEGVPCD